MRLSGVVNCVTDVINQIEWLFAWRGRAMRTIDDVRNQLLERLHGALTHPSVYGGTQFGVQFVLQNLLHDLTYIDERESELAQSYSNLETRGMWWATGLIGPFSQRFEQVHSFSAEIASVFAEISYNFRYVNLSRTLSDAELKSIRRDSRQILSKRDLLESQIKDRFGDPSFAVCDSWHHVHCYASHSANGWVFLDFTDERVPGPPPYWKYESDYILRNVRLPTPQFGRGIVYNPYGRRLK